MIKTSRRRRAAKCARHAIKPNEAACLRLVEPVAFVISGKAEVIEAGVAAAAGRGGHPGVEVVEFTTDRLLHIVDEGVQGPLEWKVSTTARRRPARPSAGRCRQASSRSTMLTFSSSLWAVIRAIAPGAS